MRRAALALLVACGGSMSPSGGDGVDASGTCPGYMVPQGTDLAQPTVSFSTDVMKVFNNSCGAVACHGSSTAPAGDLFLGAESAMTHDASTVYAGIVGKPSGELPTMMFVTAGDPDTSYLMHKLDGDQCQYQASCTGADCQHLMPSDADEALPVSTRDIVRRWIAQGAMAN